MLPIPVVFIIFNRPDVTKKVFKEIRRAQPSKLLIVADGPRNEAEREKCRRARDIIKKVDWPCEVLTNYSDINLGCRRRISSGLNWAFSIVEEAIILEDDCLPSLSFFSFCKELLEHYRDDERIWAISGNNFQDGQWRGDGSYYFSRYFHCWGWATWKRAWRNYDADFKNWPKSKELSLLNLILDNPTEVNYWNTIFDQLADTGVPDTWDYIWLFTCWENSGLTILPNINLVSNIGFGKDSTNTEDSYSSIANLTVGELNKINHPSFIIPDKGADSYTFDHYYNSANRDINKFLKTLKSKLAFLRPSPVK